MDRSPADTPLFSASPLGARLPRFDQSHTSCTTTEDAGGVWTFPMVCLHKSRVEACSTNGNLDGLLHHNETVTDGAANSVRGVFERWQATDGRAPPHDGACVGMFHEVEKLAKFEPTKIITIL